MSRGRISSSNKIHKHDDYIIMKLHDCQENFRKLQVKFVSRKKSADNFEDDTRPSGRKFADKWDFETLARRVSAENAL